MKPIKIYFRRAWLFVRIVFRDFEGPISPVTAWQVACIIHPR